jgi:hypothetical protein
MIKEGLYLEEKKGVVGEAKTSKQVVYKNFWVTREIDEGGALLQLLDNKGQPTGLVERVGPTELARRFTYQPLQPDAWAALKQKVASTETASAAPVQAKKADKPKPAPQEGNWWEHKRG